MRPVMTALHKNVALLALLCGVATPAASAQRQPTTRSDDTPNATGIAVGRLHTEREGEGISLAWIHSAEMQFMTLNARILDIGLMPVGPADHTHPYSTDTNICANNIIGQADSSRGCGPRLTLSFAGEMLGALPITPWTRIALGFGDRFGSTAGLYTAASFTVGSLKHFHMSAEYRAGHRFNDFVIAGTVPIRRRPDASGGPYRRPGL
jgi:hypothetical protein